MTTPSRRFFPRILALLAAAVAAAGCGPGGGSRKAPVPRPYAWPRVEPYPASFTRSIDGFAVNDSVVVAPGDSAGWYTLLYPRYNVRVYATITRVAPRDLPGVIDNRTRRISLNTGGGLTRLTELTSEGGFDCVLATTPSGTITPLQFLAHDSRGRVVTGALVVDGAASAQPDSAAPVIEAVERDLIHALKHLK